MNNINNLLNKCVILDFETTGLDFRTAEIIEYGIAQYDTTWDITSSFCEPSEPIDPEVSAITNITDEMVSGSKPFQSHLQVFDFLSKKYIDGHFIAHNSFYDSKMLEKYKKYPNTWICTFRLAKKLFGQDPTVRQFNLPYLRYRFKLDVPAQYSSAHRADADACITGLLFKFLIEEMEAKGIIDPTLSYSDQIIDYINRPIIFTTMTFGKYKGTPMAEIPHSYWRWCMENMKSLDDTEDEYDPDFAASIAHALGVS